MSPRAATSSTDLAATAINVSAQRWLWAFAAALAAVIFSKVSDPWSVWRTLGDTDDAMRLVQVRALLDGQAWFDFRQAQVGLPDALVSHWSRLIDAPLVVLLGALETIVEPRVADTIVRVVWPVGLLTVMLWLATRETEREFGTIAGVVCLFLAATSSYATFQFMPGRIDHHSVQIIGAAGGTLVLFRALHTGHGAVLAGALFALGLAVGYEAMPLVVAILGLAVAAAACAPRLLPVVATALTTLTLGLSLALLVSVAPADWLSATCDALGLNFVAFTAIGALTVQAVALKGGSWPLVARFGVLAAGGCLALGVYASIAPACMAGPLGQVDPAIKPIWLDNVREGQNILAFGETKPAAALLYVLVLVAAAGLAALQWRREPNATNLLRVSVIAIAGLYGCIFAKFFPYAMWIAIPAIAPWLARLPAIGDLPARTVRLAGAIFASHITLLTLVTLALTAVGITGAQSDAATTRAEPAGTCFARDDLERLAAMPPGRVMNSIDLGPHIAAHSGHRVMSAPYHRIDRSILLWHRISHADLATAETELRRHAIDYVILCAQPVVEGADPSTFENHLRSGGSVPYLQPVKLDDQHGPLKVWKLKPARLRGSIHD